MTPIHGSLTETDYLAAQRLHMKPRPIFAAIGVLLLVVAFVALYLSRSWSVGMALAFLAAIFFIYLPLKSKRIFRQYKALSEQVAVELRDEGLYFKRENGEGLVPWAHLMKWKSNEKLLLLYPASSFFYLLPSHFFTSRDAFREFIQLVESKLGKAT